MWGLIAPSRPASLVPADTWTCGHGWGGQYCALQSSPSCTSTVHAVTSPSLYATRAYVLVSRRSSKVSAVSHQKQINSSCSAVVNTSRSSLSQGWDAADSCPTSISSSSTCTPSLIKHNPISRSQATALSPSSSSFSNSSNPDQFTYISVELPPCQNTRIRTAEFVKSSKKVADCPPASLPEFAVIGRSNVGKSSLINTLSERDGLAKVSKEPGMTQLINHYLMNGAWYLVDLPGYGFAKAAKGQREAWLKFTKNFFVQRDSLVHVLLLLDSSLPPQPIDVECANWLAECEVPFAVVFTKTDMRKKDMPTPAANIKKLKSMLAEEWEALPLCFETSSRTGAGRSELLAYLGGLRELHLQNS